MNACVLVRDCRYRFGGFETWVEALATRLPDLGLQTIVLTIGDAARSAEFAQRCPNAQIVTVPACENAVEQARAMVQALEALAVRGASGVLLAGGYSYIDLAAINLRDSPWLPVPVMHGRHPGAYDWVCLGPPKKAVAPARDLAVELRAQMILRIGRLRAFGRVAFIPHGVRMPASPSIAARPASGPLQIAVVSRLDPDLKRPMDYIRIAQALALRSIEFRMRIAGDGPARLEMELAAAAAGLGTSIAFDGGLDPDAVYSLLGSSHVFLQTSESEAFGLAVAEALACGCAVVAADVGGEVARMVNRTTGIRVPVGDIEAFADALQSLGQSRPHTADLGRRGHQLVARQYSVERMARRYAKLIRGVGRKARSDTGWRAPQAFFTSPAQAVGPGLKLRCRDWLRVMLRSIARAPRKPLP